MNFRQKITLCLLLYMTLCSPAFAQVVHFPDPNLRTAVAEAISADPDRITVVALRRLERLDAVYKEIESLEGLQHATNLRLLDLDGNRISDLTPLAGLRNLEELGLDRNVIKDITPLAGLTNLLVLTIEHNQITDVEPLRGLTKLRTLVITQNLIDDHSPLEELVSEVLRYDQACDMPHEPLESRLADRSFPSIFASFTPQIVNKDEPWTVEMPYHDMIFSGHLFGDHFRIFDGKWQIMGSVEYMIDRRDEYFALNPNTIFLLEVRIRDSGGTSPPDAFPDNHPYWLRDESGAIAIDNGRRLINFAHPVVHDIIVGQALAIGQCGLYDGVFFDWWTDFDSPVGDHLIPVDVAQRARLNIVNRIREGTRPNFLIVGNVNDRIAPLTGPFINGGFMEGDVVTEPWAMKVRDSLQWLETNLREPRVLMLQGRMDHNEPLDSPSNLRRMRATTTMSLTHSDGYVHFTLGPGHEKFWYDFWEVDLGQPVGSKIQFYDNTEGLYIREFDNGWAVYNQSGQAQVIELPQEVQSVANGLPGTEHAVLHIDGDIFLKVKTANPADVNGDGIVNILDLILVAQGLGTDDPEVDVNGDGVVNVFDLVFVANQF